MKIRNRQGGAVIFDGPPERLAKANLRGADLSGADLSVSCLRDVTGIDPEEIRRRTITPEGELIGWKQLSDGTICKLRIPAGSRRLGGLTGRKCRAEFAYVLEGAGFSYFEDRFRYRPGGKVTARGFDPDPRNTCSGGIHFYLTKTEAENHVH